MITLKNVTLRRSAKVLLEHASVTLNPGEKVGLVGRNGAGKSSLFALLNGNLHEDAGEYYIPTQWRMGQVAQDMPETEQSATEFVVQGDTVLQAARAFCYQIGKNLDQLGSEHVRQVRKDCASVILWCAEEATKMAGNGVQIFGGNGYINEYPLGRLWRDAKLYEIGAGTSEIRRMLIGRELFAETC